MRKITPGINANFYAALLAKTTLASALATLPMPLVTPAFAACAEAGTQLTCDGDLSGGENRSSATITDINISSLTTDIGNRGFFFNQTGGLDIAFNVDLGSFQMALQPLSNNSSRNGFHILTDGSVVGTFNGDVTGLTLAGGTISPLGTLLIQNFGAFGIDAGGAVDLTHNGLIDVDRADIIRTSGTSDRLDLTAGRFAALRVESEVGDVDITNNGNINLDGGSRTVRNDEPFNDPAGTATITFTNAFSENLGIHAQGNGDLNLTQTGDITITNGDAFAFSRTEGNVADAQADASDSIGIFIPRFTSVGGATDFTLPVFEDVVIQMDGDIDITGGVSDSEAIGFNLTDGGTGQEAIAEAIGFSSFSSGVSISNGEMISYTQTGDINVVGGAGQARAAAVGATIDDADGPVHVNARGQFAEGISIRHPFNFNGPRPDVTTAMLDLTGEINVTGGNAQAVATGTSIGTINQLALDLPNIEANAGLLSRGGGATGISIFTDQLTLSIDGPIQAIGGSATGEMNGSGYAGDVRGGLASGLNYSSREQLNYAQTRTVNALGGAASLTANGTDMSGVVSGGAAGGIDVQLNDNSASSHTQQATLTATGGNAEATGQADTELAVTGGSATAAVVSSAGDAVNNPMPGSGKLFRNEADIVARGGDASITGGTSSSTTVGGGAFGIAAFSSSSIGVAPFRIEHAGTLTATGGAGQTRQGVAQGIAVIDFGISNVEPDGSEAVSEIVIDVTGRIDVAGGVGNSSSSQALSRTGGILAQSSGTLDITIDGTTVSASGADAVGIATEAGAATIRLINNASLESDSDGIILGPNPANFFLSGQFRPPSTNVVTVEAGSRIASANGAGISENNIVTEFVQDPDTMEFVQVESPRLNDTLVNLFGTVSGGNGTAIDFRGGEDELALNPTATVGGDVIKSGDGSLRINGNFAGSFNVQANDGTTFVESALGGVAVLVGADGAFVSRTEIASLMNNGRAGIGTGLTGDTNMLAVNGDFTNGAGAIFQVDIVAPDTSDLLDVTGAANLGGTLRVNGVGMGFATSDMYTVIVADGGVDGEFADVMDNLPDLDAEAIYEANAVRLGLVAATTGPDPELSDKSIFANTLQATTRLARHYMNLLLERAAAEPFVAQAGLQITPSAYAAGDNRAIAANGSATASNVWGGAFGAKADVAASSTASGYDADMAGFAMGADVDRAVASDTILRAGASVGYVNGQTNSGLSTADKGTWIGGLYAGLKKGLLTLSAAGSYGAGDLDFARPIPVTGMAPLVALGRTVGQAYALGLEASYDIAPLLNMPTARQWRIAPLVRFDHAGSHYGEFVETGAGALNQTVEAGHWSRSWAGLGLELSTLIDLEDGTRLRPEFQVRYEQAFGEDNAIANSTIAGVSGADFASPGAHESKSSFVVGAGLNIEFTDRFSSNIRYDGAFSQSHQSHVGSARFSLKF